MTDNRWMIFVFFMALVIPILTAFVLGDSINIDWSTFFAIYIPAILTIAGWWYTYKTQVKQDLANKKKEKVVEYLIVTYKGLSNSVHRGNIEDFPKQYLEFEAALSYIQLLGSSEQIDLARTIANNMSESATADIDKLLKDLRSELRKELDLTDLGNKAPFFHYRFNPELTKNK